MPVPNSIAIYPIVVEKFHSKPQMWDSWWHNWKSQKNTKVIGIHHLGTMNVCTHISANPSSGCWHISADKWNFWPAAGAKWNLRGLPKSLGFFLWVPSISVHTFLMAIHIIVVGIRATLIVWLKMTLFPWLGMLSTQGYQEYHICCISPAGLTTPTTSHLHHSRKWMIQMITIPTMKKWKACSKLHHFVSSWMCGKLQIPALTQNVLFLHSKLKTSLCVNFNFLGI